MNMDFNRYQELAARTANGDVEKIMERMKNNPHLVMMCNFAMGLAGEAGEVADMLKKVIFHGHELDEQQLNKELGDVAWYLSQLANVVGIPLQDVAVANIEKLAKRYPDGFKEIHSINREE